MKCDKCGKTTYYRLVNTRFQTKTNICYNCLNKRKSEINPYIFQVEVLDQNGRDYEIFNVNDIFDNNKSDNAQPKENSKTINQEIIKDEISRNRSEYSHNQIEKTETVEKNAIKNENKKSRKKNIITAIIVATTLLLITCIPVFSSICFHSYYETYSSTSTSCNKVLKCSKCGKEKIISSESHTFSSETVSENATCTKRGGTYHKCSKCGYKDYITTIPATGHDYILEATETHYAETNACTRCGTKLNSLITIDATRSYSYSYYTFRVKVKNYSFRSLTFVKAKLYVLDSNGIIFTDWTYAIDSMPLEYGETRSFEKMVYKDDIAGMKYFYFEYYN